MKRVGRIFNAIVVVAVALCFVQCKDNSGSSVQSVQSGMDSTSLALLPIAYINMDSLLSSYNYARDLYEAQLLQAKEAHANLNEKDKAFQKEVAEFQRKVQINAFLSEQSARSQEEQLGKKQQELQALAQRIENEYISENQKNGAMVADSINNFLKEYNKVKKYGMIFSTTANGNILLADPRYDITNEVIQMLNKRYSKK